MDSREILEKQLEEVTEEAGRLQVCVFSVVSMPSALKPYPSAGEGHQGGRASAGVRDSPLPRVWQAFGRCFPLNLP